MSTWILFGTGYGSMYTCAVTSDEQLTLVLHTFFAGLDVQTLDFGTTRVYTTTATFDALTAQRLAQCRGGVRALVRNWVQSLGASFWSIWTFLGDRVMGVLPLPLPPQHARYCVVGLEEQVAVDLWSRWEIRIGMAPGRRAYEAVYCTSTDPKSALEILGLRRD